MTAILVFQNNETAAMLVYKTNPVGVQLFSYVNTFFCHVGVPNQSCGSSTLFLCKHFLLPCWWTKPILWEFNSFLYVNTLNFIVCTIKRWKNKVLNCKQFIIEYCIRICFVRRMLECDSKRNVSNQHHLYLLYFIVFNLYVIIFSSFSVMLHYVKI